MRNITKIPGYLHLTQVCEQLRHPVTKLVPNIKWYHDDLLRLIKPYQPEDVVQEVDVPDDPLGGVGGAFGPVERLEGEQELVRLQQLPQHREAQLVVELVVGYRTADERVLP